MLQLRRMKKYYSHNEIQRFITKHRVELAHDLKLERYYKNNNDINMVHKADGKANHHCSNPFAHQIVSTMTSYFASKPVQITSDNEVVQEALGEFLRYNDFDKVLIEVTENVGIYGNGAILTFIDANGNVRFASVNPTELIVIRDNDVLGDVHTIIRSWECESNDNGRVHYVEVYDAECVRKFYIDEKEIFNEVVEPHYFGDVPFTIFQANQQNMGFFERVIPLIDSYDLLQSETLNLTSDLSDAILLIAGVELGEDEIHSINQMRLLNVSDIESGVDVRYITKDAPTNEETKTRLRNDIFSLSQICDINSEAFGQAVSGTALKIKMSSMEFLAGVMEGYFKLAIRRLVELWANVGQLLGGVSTDEIIRGLSIRMERNIVSNEAEQIQNALQLSSLLSKETILGLLTNFITDVAEEQDRLAKEQEEKQAMFNPYGEGEFEQPTEDTEDKEDKEDKEEQDE